MNGIGDFLQSLFQSGAQPGAAPVNATAGPGSAADPFKPLPTDPNQGGLLSGITPASLGQAGKGMQDDPSQPQAQAPNGGQHLAQMQQMMMQLLGGR